MTRALQLNWKGYYDYTEINVQKFAPTKAGVYKISFEQQNGKLLVRYVGQTDNLDRRLKEHLDIENEQNEYLRERLRKYRASFSFAEISTQSDRDCAEKALYDYYEPLCNNADAIPDMEPLNINFT